jgi:hypothetical protein
MVASAKSCTSSKPGSADDRHAIADHGQFRSARPPACNLGATSQEWVPCPGRPSRRVRDTADAGATSEASTYAVAVAVAGRHLTVPPLHRSVSAFPCAGASPETTRTGQGHREQSKVVMWKPDIWTPVRTISRWSVDTQIGARRNALVASTALHRGRRERDEVEHFLHDLSQHTPTDVDVRQQPSRQARPS